MDKLKLGTLEVGVEREDIFYGAQVGVMNVAEEAMYGAQVGYANVAEEVMYGAQVGALNVAGEARGAQVGAIINLAGEATGAQVGLVDIVIEADRVLQVGGICIIASNPCYAKFLPFLNYGGSKAAREMKKRLKAEALETELIQLEKDKLNVRV